MFVYCKSKNCSEPQHNWYCERNPQNKDLELDYAIPHRDGTIGGYLNWLFAAVRCDAKIDRLQEALDRIQNR